MAERLGNNLGLNHPFLKKRSQKVVNQLPDFFQSLHGRRVWKPPEVGWWDVSRKRMVIYMVAVVHRQNTFWRCYFSISK
jgi:hypothetical protein